MNKKNYRGIILLFSLCIVGFSSCKDEDEPNIVKLTEVGIDNSKKAIVGSYLHLECSITADEMIQQIDIEILQKNGSFRIEKSYTEGKYMGIINANFHEHIDIPDDAPVGEYRLLFAVTNLLGQTTTVESVLVIEAAPKNISIKDFTFGANCDNIDNKIGYIGTSPVMKATSIKAEYGINKIIVDFHNETNTPEFEIDTTYIYNGEIELTDFHKHISIPDNAPSGNYHLHFKVYDNNGNILEKSLDIEIQETGIEVTNVNIGDRNESVSFNIHTDFKVKSTDPIVSIRIRVYHEDDPIIHFVDNTYSDGFRAEDTRDFMFHTHLDATGVTIDKYIFEIKITDSKGAYKIIKADLMITGLDF